MNFIDTLLYWTTVIIMVVCSVGSMFLLAADLKLEGIYLILFAIYCAIILRNKE